MRFPATVIPLACALATAPALSRGALPQAGTRYLHADHRGDVVLVSDTGGRVAARREQRPWGDPGHRTGGTGDPRHAFDGWELDAASGLMYAGARHYDAGAGRFLSVDPQRQSVYAALAASPLEHVDPGGRRWFRFRANGRAAFEEVSPGRYRKVRASKQVLHTDPPLPDDIYIAEGETRLWDSSIFDGWMRRDIRLSPAARQAIDRYVNSRKLDEADERFIRKKIRNWVGANSRHMIEDPGEIARIQATEMTRSSPGTSPGLEPLAPRTGTGSDAPATLERGRGTGMASNTTSFTATAFREPVRGASPPSMSQPLARRPADSPRVHSPERLRQGRPWQRRQRRRSLLARLLPEMSTEDPGLGRNWLWPRR